MDNKITADEADEAAPRIGEQIIVKTYTGSQAEARRASKPTQFEWQIKVISRFFRVGHRAGGDPEFSLPHFCSAS